MRRTYCWVVLLLLAIVTVDHRPICSDTLDDDHTLDGDFVTPHTDWARPYARGKVRVLYFTSVPFSGVDYCKARQMVELMQRFDVEAQAVYWAQMADTNQWHWHGGEAGERRIMRLLDQPFDCYLFDRVPLSNLSLPAQYKLIRAVADGTGLVFVGTEDKRVFKPENHLQNLPTFLQPARPAGAYTIKQGRGVAMGPHPDTPYRVGWQVGYDYWQERLGRALLWAANRVPEDELSVTVDAAEIDRAILPRQAITVRWRNATASRSSSLDVRLRSDDGEVVAQMPEQRVDAGEGSRTYDVPLLRAGLYHIDVRTRSQRGIESWATGSFVITSSRKIKSLDLDRDWGEIGENLSGRVTLTGDSLSDERLRIQLVDSQGRILMRKNLVPRAQPITFSFPISSWFPMLVRVEAMAMQGAAVAASDYRFAHVVKRHRDQFNFLTWEAPQGPLGDYVEEALARLGVTVQLMWFNPPIELAAHDVAWVAYSTRILGDRDAKGIMLPACWNDEPNINKYVQDVVKNFTPSRYHGVFAYSLGDETVTRGSCIHPACLAAYKRYLQGEYQTIGALNASWGSNYQSFDDVTLSAPDDNDEAQAKRAGNYPRWYDRQAFQCYNFVQLCKRFGEAFRAIDPQARTGFEGAGSFDDGDDYDLIIRTNGFWSPYPGLGDEIIRSVAPHGFPHSNWMGYTKDPDTLLSKYWRMVTRGCDSVWWWMWPNMGAFNGLLRPTLSPFPAVREIVKDTQVVRDGLGTLLIHSQMQHDGIAFVYSMPSAYASRVEQGPAFGPYAAAHEAWSRTVHELDLQYRYVTDRMLRLGEFNPSEFKVVVLSRMEAIGPREAAVLRKFVEEGGTVIADVRPGIFDGHCKPLKQGALDDVFGIARSANAAPVRGAAEIGVGGSTLRIENVECDPSVSLADGRAGGHCGNVPLVISHRYGKGRAILLNFTINSFPSLWLPETPRTADRFINALFTDAGVQPKVRVLDAKGERERNLEIVRWRNGDSTLFTLFREAGPGSEVKVEFSDAAHLYDLRNHQYLGRLKSARTKVVSCRATFFAVTSEKVRPAQLSLRTSELRQGEVGEVSIRGDSRSSLRAVLLTATSPDGKDAEWLRRVVMVPTKGVTVPLPIAFNDPRGKWTLRARELFSNEARGATLVVR